MRIARRGVAASAMMIGLASCAAIPQSAPPPVAPPVPVVREMASPERASFAFEGALSQGGLVLGTAPSNTVSLTLDGAPVPVDGQGRFVIAFDRDAGPSAQLLATLAGGRTVAERLVIASRSWDIERVNIPRTGSTPSAAFERIRVPEVAQINASRAISSVTQGWLQRFQWPVKGRISGLFGSQRIYRGGQAGAYHSGVDIAGGTGVPVTAPADGVVVLAAAQPFTLEGNLLIIDHGMGLNSAFLHLSRIDVRVGDRVSRGQLIGAIGATGRATGPHLHWAMKWRDARIDPMLLAGPMPSGAIISRASPAPSDRN